MKGDVSVTLWEVGEGDRESAYVDRYEIVAQFYGLADRREATETAKRFLRAMKWNGRYEVEAESDGWEGSKTTVIENCKVVSRE